MFSLSSCSEWLDVNDNPNNPSSSVPTVDQRLQGIQTQFVDAYESGGTRGSWITGNIAKTSGTLYNDYIIKWNPNIGSTTWPYQVWFIYGACNLEPLIDRAEAEGAYHYIGAAQLLHAWGFMLMTDLYGEMPYTEALTDAITPKYDDGKTIFYGCLDMLEQAIANLSKEQEVGATPLVDGDIWNQGSTDKWLKLAYGLKARWLNNLSKKSSYDPDAILEALDKAATSVADNTVMRYINDESSTKSSLRALQHQNLCNTTSRMTKWYTDLLTNDFAGGSGVVDPRADLMIPSGQYMVDGELKYVRAQGVDMYSDIRLNAGPVTFDVYAVSKEDGTKYSSSSDKSDFDNYKDAWYTTSQLADRQGDSIYTPIYSEAASWITIGSTSDDRYLSIRYNGMTESTENDGRIISTGTFYTRADGPGHLVCYHEMCFIRAEVLFRKGDKAGALTAYKAGIKAHMEAMNEKLKEYDQDIFGKQVISADAIDAFLSSAAVAQTSADLTMTKIMQQKFIAMSYSIQNWNDMRRMNYGATGEFGVVYAGFDRPAEFNASSMECYPTDDKNSERYWMRRFQQCSHEVNYNSTNLQASNPEALERTIVSYPVWWDTDEE